MELENADIQKVILNFQGQKSLFFQFQPIILGKDTDPSCETFMAQ